MSSGRTFEFLSELAEGSFGKVYLARMNSGETFSSVVAVKLLHGPWAQNKEVLARVGDDNFAQALKDSETLVQERISKALVGETGSVGPFPKTASFLKK